MKDKANSVKELIVIGGGAAGFFCAVNAARLSPGLRVTIIEKSDKLLSKVRISGGGRCNLTREETDIREMSQGYPRGEHFVRKAFHQFFTTDTIHWFAERGVKIKKEDDGRMFPESNSSQTVIDCLLKEANRFGIQILMNAEAKAVESQNGRFVISLSGSRQVSGDFLCIATGGYPKSSMFDWLRQTGHTIETPVPSLFTFNLPGHPITKLMGISVERVTIRIKELQLEEEGPLLITHWGLSGPVVLRLSAWGAKALEEVNYTTGIKINWTPGYHENLMKEKLSGFRTLYSSQKVLNKNYFGLPARLWVYLCGEAGITEEMRWADLPAAAMNKLVKNLCSFEAGIKGKTTFKEEFVTAGGIRLSEVDPGTMMSRKLPALFFAGEVLDVDGITGGYNFQHAWTSGFIAAKSIAERISVKPEP